MRLCIMTWMNEEKEREVIGFWGGSITQGSLASKQENCYAALVYKWWSKQLSLIHI